MEGKNEIVAKGVGKLLVNQHNSGESTRLPKSSSYYRFNIHEWILSTAYTLKDYVAISIQVLNGVFRICTSNSSCDLSQCYQLLKSNPLETL